MNWNYSFDCRNWFKLELPIQASTEKKSTPLLPKYKKAFLMVQKWKSEILPPLEKKLKHE